MKACISIRLLLLLAGTICAAQQVEIKQVPIQDVSPASGEHMYQAYCASCHGLDGKGNGPAATALKTRPTDLTLVVKNHNGAYVYDAILGDVAVPAHGNKDMPVWGDLFYSLSKGKPNDRVEIQQRASNITTYIESLARK